MYDNWVTVWSDSGETEKILHATKGQLSKFREELNAGTVTVKLPFLEYTTGQSIIGPPLEFEREVELTEALNAFTREQLIEQVSKRKPFKPFVAMLEGNFIANIHLPDMLKCEWKFYKDSGLLSDDSERVIEDLLKLPDWELVKRFEEAHYMISPTEYRNKFQEKFRTEVERKNPSISQIVSDHLAKMKPTLQGRYNGENCLVYSTENIEPPLVYFPEAAREYLPDAFGFYGRITGIVNYVANPPLKGAPSLILRATVLSLPLA